jgi:hypothetical protein
MFSSTQMLASDDLAKYLEVRANRHTARQRQSQISDADVALSHCNAPVTL